MRRERPLRTERLRTGGTAPDTRAPRPRRAPGGAKALPPRHPRSSRGRAYTYSYILSMSAWCVACVRARCVWGAIAITACVLCVLCVSWVCVWVVRACARNTYKHIKYYTYMAGARTRTFADDGTIVLEQDRRVPPEKVNDFQFCVRRISRTADPRSDESVVQLRRIILRRALKTSDVVGGCKQGHFLGHARPTKRFLHSYFGHSNFGQVLSTCLNRIVFTYISAQDIVVWHVGLL